MTSTEKKPHRFSRAFKIAIITIALATGLCFHPAFRAAIKVSAMSVIEHLTPPPELTEAEERWKTRLGSDVALPLPDVRIVVHKAARKLEVFSGEEVVSEYEIALGRRPVGPELPKLKKGDGQTPVGDYYICTRLPESRFHLFLGLSYPNSADADAALAAGVIDNAAAEAIKKAIDRERKPPWDTPAGGAIGIHGGSTDFDWTQGCVAVSNEAVEEIFVVTEMGTPVTILP